MLVKFFENNKGGGVGSIYYLLNDRVQEGTARLLRGDKWLTLSLINAIEFKHKVTFGSLNFTEKNLPDNIKTEIMDRFEKMLLAGLERYKNYNILWVEHTDKENLELNFVIPKIELQSLKSLQPYYHKADLSRVDTFKEIINLEYDLSDPNDPARESTVLGSRKKKGLFQDVQELENIVKEQVLSRYLNSRDEVIAYLRENGVEVPKISKEYISVKLPEAKKTTRLKGVIFNERFTDFESLTAEFGRVEARVRDYQRERIANRFPRLRELYAKLERLCDAKARENNKRFERSSKRNKEFKERANRNDTERIQEQQEPTTRSEKDLQGRTESAHIQSFDNSGRSCIFGGGLHPLQNNILGGSSERERILRELIESATKRARERARKSNEAHQRSKQHLDEYIQSTRTREKRYIEQNAEFRSWLNGAFESFKKWSRERTRRQIIDAIISEIKKRQDG
jgi:mobilization protein